MEKISKRRQQQADDLWLRLDNTAKSYPMVTSENTPYVFRLSVELQETIDPIRLNEAVQACKKRFPSFYVKLKHGFFWYYFEENEKPPVVLPEPYLVCAKFDASAHNGYFFTFYYYKNRISLELFHCLADGKGATELLKAVVFFYLERGHGSLQAQGKVLLWSDKPDQKEYEDGYVVYNTGPGPKVAHKVFAYHVLGKRFRRPGMGIIRARVLTEKLLLLAKESNASLTQYMTALFAYAILQTANPKRLKKRPIRMSVPVDLRGLFGAKTLRNFFVLVTISISPSLEEQRFDAVLENVIGQFKAKTQPAYLKSVMHDNVALEKNLAVKLVPLPIKWAAIQLANRFRLGRCTTATISNIGIIDLPEEMKKHVRFIDVYSSVSSPSTHLFGLATYNKTTSISFSRKIYETKIEQLVLTHLTARGLDVEVQSNYWERFA